MKLVHLFMLPAAALRSATIPLAEPETYNKGLLISCCVFDPLLLSWILGLAPYGTILGSLWVTGFQLAGFVLAIFVLFWAPRDQPRSRYGQIITLMKPDLITL